MKKNNGAFSKASIIGIIILISIYTLFYIFMLHSSTSYKANFGTSEVLVPSNYSLYKIYEYKPDLQTKTQELPDIPQKSDTVLSKQISNIIQTDIPRNQKKDEAAKLEPIENEEVISVQIAKIFKQRLSAENIISVIKSKINTPQGLSFNIENAEEFDGFIVSINPFNTRLDAEKFCTLIQEYNNLECLTI